MEASAGVSVRYSVHPQDSGYAPYQELRKQGKDVRVYLDGILVKHCVTADDDKRYVEMWSDKPLWWDHTDIGIGHVYLETYYR